MPDRDGGRAPAERAVLRAALGDYPHTAALREGRISSDLLALDFVDIAPINRAFAPMLREHRFDVSEIAIASFLQAKAYGKRFVLLPVVLAARFQEPALLCLAGSAIRGPADLAGRRVGVRAYGQTTGVWLRGILADAYGVGPEAVRWVTFEDAHVAEYRDPPWIERAPLGADLMGMLRQGAIDAVIVGNDLPADPTLRTVFPDPTAAGQAFWRGHGIVPINHMVTVGSDLAESRPDLVGDLVRMFREAAAADPDTAKRLPYAVDAASLAPALALALRYAGQQGLLPRTLSVAELWAGLPAPLLAPYQRVSAEAKA
jgi:4,5-dihydroxyphthalate decarboxylase